MFMPWSSNDKGIRKLDFVAKTQFLCFYTRFYRGLRKRHLKQHLIKSYCMYYVPCFKNMFKL